MARRRLLVTGIVVLAVVGGGYYYLSTPQQTPTGGGGPAASPVLPQSPKQTVIALYGYVADDRPDEACVLFTKPAAQGFARDLGNAAGDCTTAVHQAASRVSDRSAYANPSFPDDAVTTSGGVSQISSCAATVDGGDPLGAFVLNRQPNGGWVIADHHTEPNPCG